MASMGGNGFSVSSFWYMDEEGNMPAKTVPKYRVWSVRNKVGKRVGFISLPVETDWSNVLVAAHTAWSYLEETQDL